MIAELNSMETRQVAGGSIIEELEERFPGGEWCGNSFLPNGVDRPWGPGGCPC